MKYDFFIALPLSLLSMVVLYFIIGDRVPFAKLAFVGFVFGVSIYALLGVVYKFPNANIPDHYHPSIQMVLRLIQAVAGLLVSYYLWIKMIEPAL